MHAARGRVSISKTIATMATAGAFVKLTSGPWKIDEVDVILLMQSDTIEVMEIDGDLDMEIMILMARTGKTYCIL